DCVGGHAFLAAPEIHEDLCIQFYVQNDFSVPCRPTSWLLVRSRPHGIRRMAKQAMDSDMTTNLPSSSMTAGESHFISHDTNRIHYVTAGQGPRTIVLIHGWSCNLGFWCEQIPALAGKARLILVDLPGHGQSDKPQTAYTMDFFAEAVLAVLRDAKVDQAIFIGHSMGGAVIARLHHHAPEKVAALVSVDGLLCRLGGSPEEGRALVGGFAASRYREHAQGFISTLFPIPGTEALRDRVTAEMLTTPQHVMLGGMLAMVSPDQPDWILQQVQAPVIVINAR